MNHLPILLEILNPPREEEPAKLLMGYRLAQKNQTAEQRHFQQKPQNQPPKPQIRRSHRHN